MIATPGDDGHARRMLYPKIFTLVRTPSDGFLPGRQRAANALIIAFIAHREGCPASE